jgi:hypothetical protein
MAIHRATKRAVGDVRRPMQRPPSRPPIPRSVKVLAAIELITGAMALVGGVLLAIRPDGSLLNANPAALRDSPFSDYRWPGILLAGLVGIGFLIVGLWVLRAGRAAAELSIVAGIGLVVFEVAERFWLGFQVLEVVFVLVGGAVIGSALRVMRSGRSRP